VKIIKYTYKFKINPTEDQKVLLNKHFGSVRWVYNYFLNNSLTLKDRCWICKCGLEVDRDLNAAKNILNEGLRLNNISVGTTDHGRGAKIRPDLSGISVETSKEKTI